MMTGAETTLKLDGRDIELRFSFGVLERIEKQLNGKSLHMWMEDSNNLFKAGKLAEIVVTAANAVKDQEDITKAFVMENLEASAMADVILLITFLVGGDDRRDEYRAGVVKREREAAKEAAKEAVEEATEGYESDDSAPVGPNPL